MPDFAREREIQDLWVGLREIEPQPKAPRPAKDPETGVLAFTTAVLGLDLDPKQIALVATQPRSAMAVSPYRNDRARNRYACSRTSGGKSCPGPLRIHRRPPLPRSPARPRPRSWNRSPGR